MTPSEQGDNEGGGTEQKGKKTYGHGQQCGDCRGMRGIRGLNCNGKNTIKIKKLNIATSDIIIEKEHQWKP